MMLLYGRLSEHLKAEREYAILYFRVMILRQVVVFGYFKLITIEEAELKGVRIWGQYVNLPEVSRSFASHRIMELDGTI